MDQDYRVVSADYRPRNEKLRGDKPPNPLNQPGYLIKCLFGSIVFTVFAKVPVYYVKYIPDIDTGKLKFYPIRA